MLPTSATAKKPEEEWGSEIVVRTATTSYCAFSIWDNIKDQHARVREVFEDTCSDIGSWTNDFEMSHKTANLRGSLDTFRLSAPDCNATILENTRAVTNSMR